MGDIFENAAETAESSAASTSALTRTQACRKNQGFAYTGKSPGKGEIYFRSIIVKDAVKNALRYKIAERTKVIGKNGKIDPVASRVAFEKAVMEYMMTRSAEVGYKNYQQKQEQLLWDHRRVMRYLKSEGRPVIFPKGDTVTVGTKTVRVRPDVAFESGPAIEFVWYKNSKPTFTQTGRKNEYNRDMQLYAGILLGRKMGYKVIRSSFYFLKFASDTSRSWAACSQGFFANSAGNIVQMDDIFDEGVENELDKKMLPLIEAMENGVEPDKMPCGECLYCDNYDICSYTLPPERTEEEEEEGGGAPAPKIVPSPQQQAVIDARSGVIRVIAAAGSGKTQTVAGRVAALIEDGTDPSKILCITFSNAGAKEMERKIAKLLGYHPEGLKVMTFNAFEYEVAKANFKELGYAKELTVIDDVRRYSQIAELLNKNPIFEWHGRSFLNFTPSKGFGTRGALQIVSDIFSQIKKTGKDISDVTPADISICQGDEVPLAAIPGIIKLYGGYEKYCKEQGLIDFDDQELLAFKVLEEHPDYLEKTYGFEHIIIDEFQDTSEWQMELAKWLRVQPSFESMMVVGDDAQSIYGFRDTTPAYILHFEDYINAPFKSRTGKDPASLPKVPVDFVRDIVLGDNYRSYQEILDLASTVLKRNSEQIDKDVIAARGEGGIVSVEGYGNPQDELTGVVAGIRAHLDMGTKASDIAVITYTKGELLKVADALTEAGIPSMFGAPEPLADNPRIKAVLAFARLVLDAGDTHAAAVAANAVIGGGLMDADQAQAGEAVRDAMDRAALIREELSPARKKELFLEFTDDICMEDEAVEHFCSAFENLDFEDILKYCRDFTLYGQAQEFRRLDEYPGVMLITAHSSKGMEWPVVFNLLDGYGRDKSYRAQVEETRRLMFVSMTRARNELHVCGTYGKTGKTIESRILNWCLHEVFDAAGEPWVPVFTSPSRKSKDPNKKPGKPSGHRTPGRRKKA